MKKPKIVSAAEVPREWVTRRRRKDAAREMDASRANASKVSTDELIRWIREDRERMLEAFEQTEKTSD